MARCPATDVVWAGQEDDGGLGCCLETVDEEALVFALVKGEEKSGLDKFSMEKS